MTLNRQTRKQIRYRQTDRKRDLTLTLFGFSAPETLVNFAEFHIPIFPHTITVNDCTVMAAGISSRPESTPKQFTTYPTGYAFMPYHILITSILVYLLRESAKMSRVRVYLVQQYARIKLLYSF